MNADYRAEQTVIASVLTEMDAELAALEQRREKTRAERLEGGPVGHGKADRPEGADLEEIAPGDPVAGRYGALSGDL